MPTAYLSLGSNIGDREGHLRYAIERLRAFGTLSAISSIYETEPVEFTDQPWFLNCAVELQTDIAPEELIRALLKLESDMGRHRTAVKGPRTIDLDILLYDSLVLDTPTLTVPHPALSQRRFVLAPLAEIAPDVHDPKSRLTVREMYEQLPEGPSVRLFRRATEVQPR